MGDGANEDSRPDHEGHRERLRARFRDGGPSALHDYELLELLLFDVIPRKDTKPAAKALIRAFGSFAGAITAPAERLAEVRADHFSPRMAEKAAIQFKLIQAAALALARAQVANRPAVSSWSALLDYVTAAMAHERNEQFRVLFLDRKNVLIADEVQGKGTVDHTPVYPREVVKRALELGATALILVHNHPSGDPTPSKADIEMTRQIAAAAQALGVVLHDHLIVGRSGHASFRSLGLI